jgi:glutathione S-transferase
MRVFHREHAGRPIRILWTLEELAQPYELTVMGREEGSGEAHRERHPLGRAPVIEDEDGTLFESAAICLALADKYPQTSLVPPLATRERALVYQWAVFAPAELEPPLFETWTQAERDPERAASARKRFDRAATAVADALGESEYLVGDRFTVADVLVGTAIAFTATAGFGRELAPQLQAYVARLSQRPAFQRAVARLGS